MRVIAYLRVSTDKQAESGAGLEAQRQVIEAEGERRGWTFEDVAEDAGESTARPWHERPAMAAAREQLRRGAAEALVVAKFDRLLRSVADWVDICAVSAKEGWEIVILDPPLDTTTASGRMVANIHASVAQFEREVIGQRTKDALAVKRSQGVILGRRSTLPAEVRARIHRENMEGKSKNAIAQGLNEDGVATGQGGKKWYHTSVAKVLASPAPPE